MNGSWLLQIALGLTLVCGGCKTLIKGGESQTVKSQSTSKGGQTIKSWSVFNLFAHPDGSIEIHADSNRGATTMPTTTAKLDSTATTQPSTETNNPNLIPNSGKSGAFGAISYTQAKSNFANAWPLALLFLGMAAGFWFLAGERLYAVVCAACAILTLLAPMVMIFVAIGVGALFLWSIRSTLEQLVTGTQAALDNLPAPLATNAKTIMATEHDTSTQRVVASLKPVKPAEIAQ